MIAVAKGTDPDAPERLAKLGGAALPFVLPRLEELTPEERARVTVALAPIARRMGVARDEAVLEDPVAGAAFWTRFWQDRSLDFRDVVVTRLIKDVRGLICSGNETLERGPASSDTQAAAAALVRWAK